MPRRPAGRCRSLSAHPPSPMFRRITGPTPPSRRSPTTRLRSAVRRTRCASARTATSAVTKWPSSSSAPPAASAIRSRPPGTRCSDVPITHWAVGPIEQLYSDGITLGCGLSPLRFCPDGIVTRAEMAIFLLRARFGPSYNPGTATGLVFADVPATHWAAAWIEAFAALGLHERLPPTPAISVRTMSSPAPGWPCSCNGCSTCPGHPNIARRRNRRRRRVSRRRLIASTLRATPRSRKSRPDPAISTRPSGRGLHTSPSAASLSRARPVRICGSLRAISPQSGTGQVVVAVVRSAPVWAANKMYPTRVIFALPLPVA